MIGSTVSHYRILEKLGGGGMGVVYKAADTRLKRTVALKFLPVEFSPDTAARSRFFREAQAASALQHENICAIHDIDQTDDGRLFICMDYYDGETIKDKITRCVLPVADVISYARQIARGLAKAHKAKIIHRDVKPANIMVTSDGEVKILDFGLAKLLGESSITHEGSTLGTIAYMPPEVVRDEAVDQRADIWSFGVLLFEMLTQRLPFRGESAAAMMYAITNEAPREIGEFRQGVPETIRQLCRRCLSKAAEERPESMEEILSGLGEGSLTVRGIGIMQRARGLPHWAIGAGAAVIAALVLLLIWRLFHAEEEAGGSMTAIGILAFKNETGDPDLRSWPLIIQTLFFQGLAGTDGMPVLDPTAFNRIVESTFGPGKSAEQGTVFDLARGSAARFVIDGSIINGPPRFHLHMRIINLQSEEVRYAGTVGVKGSGDLENGVDSLCREVVNFIRLQVLSSGEQQDLKPWLPPQKRNLSSVNAFITATDYKYRGDTNATRYLRQAIALDSTFISPRVWLISDLLQGGYREEAGQHSAYLAGLSAFARPFERTMIEWAEACVAGDTSAQMRHLRTALEYSPGNNILLYNLARLVYARGDYAGVVQMLRPASEMRWPYSRMYYLLGASYIQLDDQEKAREILEASFVMTPVYPEIYRLLMLLCDSAGDTAMAQRYQRTFVMREQERGIPTSTALVSLARSGASWGLYEEARSRYSAAITLAPESLSYRRELADMLLSVGDTARARDEYLKLHRLDSVSTEAEDLPGLLQRFRR
jgi:Flp pilus assembly protein TadD